MIPPIEPMLAAAGKPFDSEDHLYEVKWDGVRCLAAVDHGGLRLWGRGLADYTDRYPEMDAVRKLPRGTLVDGELVVLREGRADLDAILRRHLQGVHRRHSVHVAVAVQVPHASHRAHREQHESLLFAFVVSGFQCIDGHRRTVLLECLRHEGLANPGTAFEVALPCWSR
jgi:hypothetical protein